MKKFKKIIALGLSVSILSSLASCDFLQEIGGASQSHVHEASEEWYSNAKAHWHKCTVEDCTLVTDKAEHRFDEGVVTKQPTDTENGETTYTCKVCGYEKTESIGKIGHVHEYDSEGVCFCEYSRNQFSKHVYTSDGYSLNYQIYVPREMSISEKAPLILFLHGAGERGSDNEAQLKNAIKKVAGKGEWANAVIIAPQCPSSTGGNTNSDVNDPNKWAETNWQKGNYLQDNLPESKPLHAAAELIQQYAGYDYIDADRVYVVGLSMGGFGTWDIISRYPDLFAAAVPICGGGPTDRIDVLKNIPIFTFHGTADGSVPYSGTEGMYNAITAAGGNKILFKTFQGAGHGIWDQAITFTGDGTLPALEEWLFRQNKKNTDNPIEIPKTYSFDVSEEDEVFTSIVDNNGPNGNGVLTSKKNSDAPFFELTQGATFTVELNAKEDCDVKFIVKILGDGTHALKDVFKNVTVTSGGQTKEYSINDGQVTLGGWYITKGNAVNANIATISLKEGKNTITFTMGNVNVNVAGVAAVSSVEITHEIANIEYGNAIKNYDPFIAENGGSFVTSGSDTKKMDNSNGVFYMNNINSTFTFTVYCEEDTEAVLSLAIVFNKAAGYATNSIITSVTSLDASGQANDVSIADAVTVKCSSWSNTGALRADFATISLKEGVNTITFVFGSNDVNIMGVYLKSESEIIFGNK